MLSLLAGGPRLLRRQHLRGGRLWEEEMRAGAGGLLRVPAPQEGGQLAPKRRSPTARSRALRPPTSAVRRSLATLALLIASL